MKVVCIKGMFAHWGSQFTLGKEYTILREKDCETYIHIDYKSYMNHLTEFIKKSQEIGHNSDLTEDQIKRHSENNVIYKLHQNDFRKKIHIKKIVVMGEDHEHEFCAFSREEIKKLYGVDSVDFEYTVYFMDDYFEYTQIRRDMKLEQIL